MSYAPGMGGAGIVASLAARRRQLTARMPRRQAPQADPYAAATRNAAAAMVAAQRRR